MAPDRCEARQECVLIVKGAEFSGRFVVAEHLVGSGETRFPMVTTDSVGATTMVSFRIDAPGRHRVRVYAMKGGEVASATRELDILVVRG